MLSSLYIGVIGILLFLILRKWKQFKYNYPPGLPVWPILGSLPHMKVSHLHFAMHKWSKTYGQVIGGSMGLTPVLFVTGADNVMAASRKEEFQGRPEDWRNEQQNTLGIFFSEGNHWADTRKFTLRQLRSFGASKMEQFMTKEINVFNDSIEDGAVMEMTGLFSLSVVNVVWLLIANKSFQPDDEEMKIFISKNKTFFRANNPQGSLGTIFRCLRPFDKSFKDNIKHIRGTEAIIRKVIDDHKEILDPNHPFDLIDNYLVEQGTNKYDTLSVDDLVVTCFEMFSAGAEPISAALDFVLLYMVLYPEVQEKMQNEIDAVLANARKPTLDDRNKLPYTAAVLSEVFRINPTAPVAVPHKSTKDTHFNGFYVEKDTTIFLDLWCLGHDPKYWDNPDKFRPERFLDDKGELKKNVTSHPFGLGPRICAGENLSKNLIFLFTTTFFEKYTLSLPKGDPKPSTHPLPGITAGPMPFRAVVKSRY